MVKYKTPNTKLLLTLDETRHSRYRSAGHLQGQIAGQDQNRIAGQQSGRILFVSIEQRQHWDKQMANHDVANVLPFSGVDGVEEYDAPEGVQQDHAKRLGGAGQQEDFRSTV